MGTETLTPAHLPLWRSSRLLAFLCCRIFPILLVIPAVTGQEITGLEQVRVIEHANYAVGAVDTYFEDGHQLIAYSNSSGGGAGDTLVIYDFALDHVLSEIPGTIWKFDIAFVDAGQLLYQNAGTLYRVTGLAAPVIAPLLSDVITFSLSPDRTRIAMLRQTGPAYQIEVAPYDGSSGSIGTPDIYPLPGDADAQRSRCAFSADGDYVAMNGGYNLNVVYIIDLEAGALVPVPTPDNEGTYSPVFYMQNGTLRVAVGGGYANGGIEVIDVSALIVEASIPVFPHYNFALAMHPSEEYLVCGGYDGVIKLFRVTGTSFTEIDEIPAFDMYAAAFTRDNGYVVTGHGGSGAARLVIWRTVSEPSGLIPLLREPLALHPNPAGHFLYIDAKKEGIVSVFDMWGRLHLRQPFASGAIDITGLPEGAYLVCVQTPAGSRIGRFIKT